MTDWTTLLVAAFEVNADEHAIEARHLKKFELVRTEEDGSVVITLDRHPSHDGRATVGQLSPGFTTLRKTFRISASEPAFELIDEENLGLTADADAIAAEEFDSLWESTQDEIRTAVATRDPGTSVPDVCERFVENWQFEVGWNSEFADTEDQLAVAEAVRARLVDLLTDRVAETGEG